MPNVYTIPLAEEIREVVSKTPTHMYQSFVPHALVAEGLLTDDICDSILRTCMEQEPYEFPGCDAKTRQMLRPLNHYFIPVIDHTLDVNYEYFKFDVDKKAGAWLQTYEVGDSYQLHNDGEIGQSRKLTTVVFLTDPSEYEEGDLYISTYPEIHMIPKTRGTMVTFPAWVMHGVTAVEEGIRQTLNLGFWGPPFR